MGNEMSNDPNDDDNPGLPESPPGRDSQNPPTNSPSPSTGRPSSNAQQPSPVSNSNSQPQASTSMSPVVPPPSNASSTTSVGPSMSSVSSAFPSPRSSPVNSATPSTPSGGNSRTEDPFSFLLAWPPFNWDHHPAAYQMFQDHRLLRAYLNRTGFRDGRLLPSSNAPSQRTIGTQTTSRSRSPEYEPETYAQLMLQFRGRQSNPGSSNPSSSSRGSDSESLGTGSTIYRTLYDEFEDDYDDDEDDDDHEEEDAIVIQVRGGPEQYSPQGQSNGRDDRESQSPGLGSPTEASQSRPRRPSLLPENILQAIQAKLRFMQSLGMNSQAQPFQPRAHALQSQPVYPKSHSPIASSPSRVSSFQAQVSKQDSRAPKSRNPKSRPQISPSQARVPGTQTQASKQNSRAAPQSRDSKWQPHVSPSQLETALLKLKSLKSQPSARQSISPSPFGKGNLSKSSSVTVRSISSSSNTSSQGRGTASGASSSTSVVTTYGSALGPVNSGTGVAREQGSPSKQNRGGQTSGSNQSQNSSPASSRSSSNSPRGPQEPSSPSGSSGSSSAKSRKS